MIMRASDRKIIFSSDFNCFQVLCGGQDIIDILEQEVIDELENQAIEIIEEQW